MARLDAESETKPRGLELAKNPTLKQTNVKYTRKTISVTNVRGSEDIFKLDRQGFQLGQLQSKLSYEDFASTDSIVNQYYEEVKAFLKQNTGAVEVLPFDFQANQTAKAAARRLCHFHRSFADQYAGRRYQIVKLFALTSPKDMTSLTKSPSVWKPLRGPAYDSPLAVCDYRTVKHDDRVPCDIIFPDYLGETYNFWPNPDHRFYYIDGQEANETWMIKCFDSATAENPEITQCATPIPIPFALR
ncbi:hypothetical protein CORC01_08439 [Colletotrichum orchidophilum]|uniref:Uncharacterized protein n=1 Tax=Colletotrichum orchidophilum TaxID=1209926 RepID=A0A1G4B479_9PEZI|nr:uncharacterized protein CORC01_08439 [Colletotrichum orchidophilum]OHE96221.1 hypothetical protein CORC01_08439 [Colletotrichum orchidophilum]